MQRLVQQMALSLDKVDATPRDTRLLHFVKVKPFTKKVKTAACLYYSISKCLRADH